MDPELQELARYLSEDFLPEQADGGLWKGKKSCAVAKHYLHAQAKKIEELKREVDSLANEVRSMTYG